MHSSHKLSLRDIFFSQDRHDLNVLIFTVNSSSLWIFYYTAFRPSSETSFSNAKCISHKDPLRNPRMPFTYF